MCVHADKNELIKLTSLIPRPPPSLGFSSSSGEPRNEARVKARVKVLVFVGSALSSLLATGLSLQGGGDFVFEVRCMSELLVKPSWGRIQQWVPAVSTNVCAMLCISSQLFNVYGL